MEGEWREKGTKMKERPEEIASERGEARIRTTGEGNKDGRKK